MASRPADEIRTIPAHKRDGKSLQRHSGRVKLDKNHAQVLIEVGSEVNTIEKAREIIEEIGVQIIQTQTLSPQWILVRLDVRGDMRDVVLNLSQNGFRKIEEYSASCYPAS